VANICACWFCILVASRYSISRPKDRLRPSLIHALSSCPSKSQYWAPQRVTDGDPNTQDEIDAFCGHIDGQTVQRQPGVDRTFIMFEWNSWGIFLSAYIWDKAHNCAATQTISKGECISVLTQAMTACDPNAGSTYGAIGSGQCLLFVSISTD